MAGYYEKLWKRIDAGGVASVFGEEAVVACVMPNKSIEADAQRRTAIAGELFGLLVVVDPFPLRLSETDRPALHLDVVGRGTRPDRPDVRTDMLDRSTRIVADALSEVVGRDVRVGSAVFGHQDPTIHSHVFTYDGQGPNWGSRRYQDKMPIEQRWGIVHGLMAGGATSFSHIEAAMLEQIAALGAPLA